MGNPTGSTFTIPADHDITIQDLLTHTSGLASGGLTAELATKLEASRTLEDTLASFVPKIGALPLDFQPESQWHYSRFFAFETLGRVVEVISGQTYEEYARGHLFDPLGMKDTGFSVKLEGDRLRRLATMYRATDGGLRESQDNNDRIGVGQKYLSTARGLASTAEDYVRFAQMLLNGGELGGKRLLSPKTVALMTSNHVGTMCCPGTGIGFYARGYGFGLGVSVLVDATRAATLASNGTFGWYAAAGPWFFVDPHEQLIGIIMVPVNVNPTLDHLKQDFQTAVMQSIVN